jgi:hypothetical protein
MDNLFYNETYVNDDENHQQVHDHTYELNSLYIYKNNKIHNIDTYIKYVENMIYNDENIILIKHANASKNSYINNVSKFNETYNIFSYIVDAINKGYTISEHIPNKEIDSYIYNRNYQIYKNI